MKRVFFLIMFLFHASYAFGQFIDTKWKVMDFLGEAWFADTKNIIGKTQDFYKGWSKGVFYSCDYAGQSATYNSYTPDEFLKNKEFSLFKKFKVKFIDEEIFVHRITCNGKKGFDRKVMYPIITQNNSKKGYYAFEGPVGKTNEKGINVYKLLRSVILYNKKKHSMNVFFY